MKRVSKLLLLVLGFSAGLLAGAFIRLGFEIINGRPVSIGGEALLLPLVILLICFGFSLGKEVRVQRNFSKAYERGYVEVFGGAAWVLFAKEKKANQLEVYNDINSNLVNLFRCVKYHCGELQREMEWMLTSREQFFDCLAQGQGRGLTDIQRAARFFYTVKISFGCDNRTYATSSKQVDNAVEYLEKVRERLRGVNIENKDFADLIKVYDRPTALFYLDPPYVDTEKYYDSPFSAQDHHRLREVLSHVKGRFILSYNDCPLVRELYADYRIEGITRTTTLAGSGNNQTQFPELIIRNF